MQELSTNSERFRRGQYVTMKVSGDSRMVLSEIQNSDTPWRHIDVKDIIALAWPRCPACGGPLTMKLMSQNLVCVRCRAEYSLTRVT